MVSVPIQLAYTLPAFSSTYRMLGLEEVNFSAPASSSARLTSICHQSLQPILWLVTARLILLGAFLISNSWLPFTPLCAVAVTTTLPGALGFSRPSSVISATASLSTLYSTLPAL